MNKTTAFLAALSLGVATCGAQVSDIPLGYCSGKLPTKGDISLADPDTHVSAAIYLPQGTVDTWAGNTLAGVRAGLASKLNIDELTVWVRTDLEGDNLAEATITTTTDPKIAKGWNQVEFTEPYEITGGTGLYIGYTYHQKGSAFGVAALSEPAANAFWLKLGDAAAWEDRSEEGTLSVEGLLRGDRLPQLNLTLLEASIPKVLIVDKGVMEVTGRVRNVATHTVNDYTVSVLRDGSIVDSSTVQTALTYGKSGEFTVTLSHGLTEAVPGELEIAVTAVNGAEDEDPGDNSITLEYDAVMHDYTRRIVVEEFTTEKCPNCPRVAGYIHNLLDENEDLAENVFVICHHSGYYTDWLTTSFDPSYLWFYGSGGTYAPAIMTDRRTRGDDGPVWLPTSQYEMEADWRRELAEPAFVSVDLTAEWDATEADVLNVTVSGSKSLPKLSRNPVVTVYLVEDEIPARAQAGAGADYIQQHVNRAVNSTWGDELVFEGDDYTYTTSFKVQDLWNRDNMTIVAMVSNNNSTNFTDCAVHNANRIELPESAGVEANAAVSGPDALYTLEGIEVKGTPAPGLYIRIRDGKTAKILVR